MEIDEHIARIRVDGEALAGAAQSGPLNAAVPGCPGWSVEALLRHIGSVHRWAAMIVRERCAAPQPLGVDGPSEPAMLLEWYRAGCESLIQALQHSAPAHDFWYWGPAPNALAFWARRQANETAVHRRDAEAARGDVTPMSARDALDALDEWLVLASRGVSVPDGGGRVLRFSPTDGPGVWCVSLGERLQVVDESQRADCELTGAASDLFLWSMNRRGIDGISVSGGADLLRVWAVSVRF